MGWFLDRIREKSTWLGIFTLVGLLGIEIEPEFREIIINAILGVAAVIAFFFREKSSNPPLPPIDLIAESEVVVKKDDQQEVVSISRSSSSFQRYVDPDDDGVRSSISEKRGSQDVVEQRDVQTEHSDSSGWNG